MKLRNKIKNTKQRIAMRWSRFKERHPKVAVAAEGFLPSLYYQIPVVGSIFATRPEFVSEKPPEYLWLWLALGSAAFIPTMHFTKFGVKKLLGKIGIERFKNAKNKMDEKSEFVMLDILGSAPSYFTMTIANKAVTDDLTKNELLLTPTAFSIGVTSAYLGLGTLWYLKHREYFKRAKKERKEKNIETISLWKRLKIFFALGFEQNAGAILLEKLAPDSKAVKIMKESAEEARKIQETKATFLEEMIELMGISRGGDLYMIPVCMCIMTAILAVGISGPDAFALYYSLSQPVNMMNSLWKNAGVISLFGPRLKKGDLE